MSRTYHKGDVIEIQAEWETTSREGVVLVDKGTEVVTIDGEVHKDDIKGVLRRMSDDHLFAHRQDLILAELPQEFRGAVSYHAWQQGHACGYDEVLSHVSDLVEAFKKPIAEYTDRIKKS